MDRVALYLRKSRADEEAEKRGEGETLSKHRKILLKIANELDLNIVKIREEIVSGESLMHRPKMLKLLREVEENMYDAVLVMDMDRLGRGNMQEQGLILETFKKSNTKIITPRKTYDLHDEFDEEYSEFEAFIARKELKIINRRLQLGRIRSVEDGNYIGTLPPYGYEIHYIGKARTLKPHPQQSPMVRMIFDLYVNEGLGSSKIANKLNALGYKSYTGKNWSSSSVLTVIKNEVYTGKVQWKKTRNKKSQKEGQIKEVTRLPRDQWINVKGKHEAIISEETYLRAQEILQKKYHVPYNTKVTNPLAGLVKCGICGTSMVYRSYSNRDSHIMCYAKCGNKSAKFLYVEEQILKGLRKWLNQYKSQFKDSNPEDKDMEEALKLLQKGIRNLNQELNELEKQKEKLHDLLERGVYDVNVYLERSDSLAVRIENIKASIANIQLDIENEKKKIGAQKDIIPKIEKVLEIYEQIDDAAEKNNLLKSVLEKTEYTKLKHQRNDNFLLILHPKLPK